MGSYGFNPQQDKELEIGYWLAVPFHGKGIMTQAVTVLCEYLFKRFYLKKITAHLCS